MPDQFQSWCHVFLRYSFISHQGKPQNLGRCVCPRFSRWRSFTWFTSIILEVILSWVCCASGGTMLKEGNLKPCQWHQCLRRGGMTWHMALIKQCWHIPAQGALTLSFVLLPAPTLERQRRRTNERQSRHGYSGG